MPSTNLIHLFLGALIPLTTAAPIRLPESLPRFSPKHHPRQSVATLCSETGYWSGDGYEVNNNNWGADSATSGSQCTYVDSASADDGVAWHTTWTWEGSSSSVKSFAYSGLQVERGHTIATIEALQTAVAWEYNTTEDVRANVAYDLFTDSDPDQDTTGGEFELMVWWVLFSFYS